MAVSRRPSSLLTQERRRRCQRAPRRLPRAGRPYVADLASFWRPGRRFRSDRCLFSSL